MAMENCLSSSQINKIDNEKLVRPKVQLQTLLKDAGADKEVFTMKEVMFYLGKYIMSKELYDKQQQHIVHCGNDALGAVLGVNSFSVKEPRALFAMISKNLIAVKIPESQSTSKERRSQGEADRGPEETNPPSSTSTPQQQQQQRRRRRSSDPASLSAEEESSEPRKRHKSDSISLTFDDSLSWCVIGGLHRERGSSESSVSQSNSEAGRSHSDESDEGGDDSDSDNFSVEFEVESIDSDAYSENDEDSVPGEDEVSHLSCDTDTEAPVYEVTIIAEDEDSFDEDTEITEEDYWKCAECDELNPPLPRNCKSCWKVRPGWLPETCSVPEDPGNHTQIETACSDPDLETKTLCAESPTPTLDPDDGVDVPDGKILRSQSTSCSDSQGSSLSHSQPSTSSSQDEMPELERTTSVNSTDLCLPASCLEPCVICQSRPKNGCIVHGRTGHLMACYTCAKKLKKRNKLCPVCREPIQSVVLTYVS
ncbi:E3 ubiquitin-protein ligase Mdm2 isoform X1 [Silurus meridionalis]|uniref:E3 ubiquitin-protein ligase Mdm2 isoform X1 n=1 Tax=Silurus meridionalis TaxID=175797 RepID=UPI001EEB313D|nr:E3 ubiquitin-protein ligase Mdm2 isoform X1 [Silurus meridionalis]XP_046729882.1 E3 ubiquitin-protein ligase Mdm2 isoform X1 [Silurus meridionalis]XP_046729883.1 E3 ubiquitin-protein ligase Mdm2 isoform X1 [Silurus meridionalis]